MNTGLGQELLSATESPVREAAPATLSSLVRGRLLTLLGEFNDAMEMMKDVVPVLESLTGAPAKPPEMGPAPLPSARNQTPPSTDVTLEVAADDPAFIDHLREALSEIAGVERVRLSLIGDRSTTFIVTLEAVPSRTDSIMKFRDALAETAGIQRVLLTEFVDDHAALAVTAGSAGSEAAATEPFSVVCAWCGRLLTVGGSVVSHGICPDCAAKATAGLPPTDSPPPLLGSTDTVVYLQRNADVWEERRQGEDGEWITNPTSYAADLPAQTVLDHASAQHPDRLVVLAGPQGQADLSMRQLRRALKMAVPVDPELLLEALASVQAVVDGVASRKDLPPDAARDLSESLDRLQETIDSIGRLAVASGANPRP